MAIRTLFIEDESWGVVPYFHKLEQIGFECILVEDGDESIKKLNSQNFDLISMDIMFPPGDELGKNIRDIEAGYRLLKMIRKGEIVNCNPGIKVIVLTAVIDYNIEKQIRQLGVSAYLKKPIEFSDVIETFCKLKKEL